MALTSINVVGQPSVLYLRRSQPSSRIQSIRPSCLIFSLISSSPYGSGFSLALIGFTPAPGNRLDGLRDRLDRDRGNTLPRRSNHDDPEDEPPAPPESNEPPGDPTEGAGWLVRAD